MYTNNNKWLTNTGLDLPGGSSNDTGGWLNGFWLGTCVVCGELTGEGVRLGILRSGARKVIQPATGEGSARLEVNGTVVRAMRRQRWGVVLMEHKSSTVILWRNRRQVRGFWNGLGYRQGRWKNRM